MLEALYFIKAAWNKVSSTTIKNCFGKAGFNKSEYENHSMEFKPEDDIPLSILSDLLRGVRELESTNAQELNDFITMDNNVQTEDENFDLETLNIKTVDNGEKGDKSESEDEVEVLNQDIDLISSYQEALRRLDSFKHFAKDDFTAFQHIKSLESHYQNCLLKQKRARLRQSSILEFV